MCGSVPEPRVFASSKGLLVLPVLLPVVRQHGFLFPQQFHSLGKSEIRGHGAEVAVNLARLDIDPLEEKDLASKGEVHAANFPVIVRNLSLLDQEVPAPVQVAQNTPPEAHVLGES